MDGMRSKRMTYEEIDEMNRLLNEVEREQTATRRSVGADHDDNSPWHDLYDDFHYGE